MQQMRGAAGSAVAMVILVAGSALAAPGALPSNGTQVNKDPARGIDPTKSGGRTDVVGGSLTAGGAESPWIAFEQKSGSGQHIFVRVFKSGAWKTQGQSLNIDPAAQAEGPAIDFAGPNRATPWVAWYEPSSDLGGALQVFASRFCAAANAVCSAANVWIPEGQDRSGGNAIPSLNIHTDRDAENPSIAGGATTAGNDPGPWVAWQEKDGNIASSGTHDQIFVSKPVKLGSAGAACPVGTKPAGGPSVSFFCWQQVGLERLAKSGSNVGATDPTLNVDPSRAGVEPDVAFTGPSDTVTWVVWYEEGASHLGLHSNAMVFAAKVVANGGADGGFAWRAEGRDTASFDGTLDNSGTNSFGACAESSANEERCALNKNVNKDAVDARVASGTLTDAGTTVPWVVWSEDLGGGTHGIFISRLVNGDHFELFNAGQPVSTITRNATKPDIEFLGHVPYVSWLEKVSGKERLFVGHFKNAATSPQFVLDTPGGVKLLPGTTITTVTGFRQPIATTCQANPFTSDGSACPGGTRFPFFSFTKVGSPQRIFAQHR